MVYNRFSSKDFAIESCDLICVIAIAKKYPGGYEFGNYSINDMYANVASTKRQTKMLIVTIMEVSNIPCVVTNQLDCLQRYINVIYTCFYQNHYEEFQTDSVMDNKLKDVNTFCRFVAVCPIRDKTNYFKIVLDQFFEYFSTADKKDFVPMLKKIEKDNTECEISVFNPTKKSLHLR